MNSSVHFALPCAISTAALLWLTACDSKPVPSQAPAQVSSAIKALPPSGLGVEDEAAVLARGQAIVKEAGALLSSNLLAAIQAKGLTNALAYCSVKALPLAELVATGNKVELRRVSHRARNPQGKADAFESEVLRHFQSQLAPNQPPPPLLTSNRADTVTFFAPIVINNPLCLQCHGEPGKDITPENLAFIRGLYPQDAATGFKVGDLRGMWRIDVARSNLVPAK